MASIITETIPNDNFELVLSRIAVILFEELSNQKILQPLNSDFSLFIERQEPYDKSEDVVVSVSCNSLSYSGINAKDSQSDTVFYIDVYCKGRSDILIAGNDDTRIKIHKYVGMIRYILSSSKYLTLGFPMGFIGGKYLKNITFDDNYSSGDGSFIRFARLTYNVRIQEKQLSWFGIPFEGNDTQVKIGLSEKGYQLTFNN